MKIELRNVILMSIDVMDPKRTIKAMHQVMEHCRFQDAVLLTDTGRHTNLESGGIRFVHHVEGDATFPIPGDNGRVTHSDYQLANLIEPANQFRSETTHVFYMESDSGIVKPDAWTKEFLAWDFIGAPWPVHQFDGWPPCDGETNAVGNFGFSIRSRKFCELVAQKAIASKDDARFSCDAWACRTLRPEFEKLGVRYAPVSLARRFSCEDRLYNSQFGFHGNMTKRINGWVH